MSTATSSSAAAEWVEWLDELVASVTGMHLGAGGGSASASKLAALDDVSTKAARIEECLKEKPVNLWELRELALSNGGLLEPRFRRQAWPLLVGFDPLAPTGTTSTKIASPSSSSSSKFNNHLSSALNDSTNRPLGGASNNLPSLSSFSDPSAVSKAVHGDGPLSKQEQQQQASIDLIKRDVGRSVVFRYRSNATFLPSVVSTGKKDKASASTPTPQYASQRLAQALENTIRSSYQPTQPNQKTPQQPYHYYQGLHDVAGAVLHQLDYDSDLGTGILQKLARSHWRDALRENFSNLTWVLDNLLLPLVERIDPHVHYQLSVTQVGMANLTLPWMITWFTHDIFDARTAGQLIDAFLAGHPLLPFYVGVALLTHPILKRDILATDPNDPASLYVVLKRLPKLIGSEAPRHAPSSVVSISAASARSATTEVYDPVVPVQELLDDALSILCKYPPRSLLDLVENTVLERASLLRRANSICLFRAASSWNLASGLLLSSSSTSSVSPSAPFEVAAVELSPFAKPHSYVRAKLASGVPLLIGTVAREPCLKSPAWGTLRFVKKPRRRKLKPRVILQRVKRMILGPEKGRG